MYPQIFVDTNKLLDKINLSTFEIFLGIGIVLLLLLIIKILEKENHYSRERTNKLLILLGVSLAVAYGFAFFFDALFHYFDDGIFEGGITFIAGMLGGVGCFMILIRIFMKEEKGNILNIMNLIIPAVPLAHGFGRLGCFSVGCCYGKPTDGIFGVLFPEGTNPYSDGIRERIHPTQLYEALFLFLLFIVLRKFPKIKNYRLSIYLMSYGVFRLILEAFFRGDSRGKLFGMDPSFLLSIIIIVAGVVILVKAIFNNKNSLKGNVNESLL
jgi:phosphatidylglycerol:prolipoprotein diacylglycerol transferase